MGLEKYKLEKNAEIEEIKNQVEENSVPADDLSGMILNLGKTPWLSD